MPRPLCIHCRQHTGSIVPLPLGDRLVALCSRCRGAAFIAEMRRLVAHG